ncbi:metal-dependent hydrolase [Bacillus spongiae]|uniref:Metal-dependent hydrolase n=1 Tax=Bacillus spongiae TaxID=2683610 RepID=A0ABU8HHA8_9BACI
MDTGTHVVMGFAIAGISTLDPVVAENTATSQAVFIAALVGSQAPDIDTVLKLSNNATYLRNHRGITHSIPAVLLWPIAIVSVLYPFFPTANLFHLWIWTFIAVFLHVFVDIFNAYGTQAIRPISSKWVALGVINTFDLYIFGFHVIGLVLWGIGFDPGWTFITIYGIIVIYYILRFIAQYFVKIAVRKTVPKAERIIISPTIHFFQWRVAIITKDRYFVARAYRRSVTILDEYKRIPLPENDIIQAAKKDKNISAFLSFSPVFRWEIEYDDEKYEVRLIDLRYRSNGHYPFVAVVHLDQNLDILNSYTGWIFSEDKLQKKLTIE